MKQTLNTIRKAMAMVYDCDRRSFWVRLICMLLLSVLPLVNIYLLKRLVDGVSSALAEGNALFADTDVGCFLLLFCVVFFLNRMVGVLNGLNGDLLSQKIVDYLNDRIQRQSSHLDMSYYDNPEYYDSFHRAQQEASTRPVAVFNNVVTLVGALISMVGIVAMLAGASWTMVLVMVLSVVPSFLFRMKKAVSVYRFRRNSTQDYRKTSYYSALLANREYAKEMRSYNLSDHFRALYVRQRRSLVTRLLRISRKMAGLDALSAVVETLALFFVLWQLLRGTVGGAFTIGSFVMLFEAFRKGQSYLQKTVTSASSLYDNRLFMENLTEFLGLQPEVVSPSSPVPFPQVVEQVSFENVSFAYPGTEKDVLSGFCLVANRGEVVSVQGENGFGKTTLLKLLLRLYDPRDGRITVNGIDIRSFDLNELRRGVGAIFQDYVRFYCTVSDNIVFGNVDTPDRARVEEAATMAGIGEMIENMPNGYDTQLGRMFMNGEELSMGQWQKLALARLYYSDAPIFFLDEPTAWMDARSRQHFYQQLDILKKNKVVILINHI